MPPMTASSPWASLVYGGFDPLGRASAVSALQGGGGGGLDLSSAFSIGQQAHAAQSDDDEPAAPSSGGLGAISPLLTALVKKEFENIQRGGDEPLTSQDKGLALARAGFGMAAGQSPHALTNIGAGAAEGIDALQKLKQERALMRMRELTLANTAQQRIDALEQQKQLAADRIAATREGIAAREREAQDRTAAAREAAAARSQAAEAAQTAAKDRADALAQQRYTVADRQRRALYAQTGQWQKIAGDEENGISGPDAQDQPYSGPQVSDPSLPLKDRNKMRVAQPKQEQSLASLDLTFDQIQKNARSLMTHPGLEGAVGFRMGQEFVPGSDAATFKAKLDSLKSQVFANAIQAMRDASRTGGAVGNVSDREGARFESMLGSLSQAQNEKEFKAALANILDYTNHLRGTYHDAYNSVYGAPEEKEQPDPLGIRKKGP